jgi:hypothetical protein
VSNLKGVTEKVYVKYRQGQDYLTIYLISTDTSDRGFGCSGDLVFSRSLLIEPLPDLMSDISRYHHTS